MERKLNLWWADFLSDSFSHILLLSFWTQNLSEPYSFYSIMQVIQLISICREQNRYWWILVEFKTREESVSMTLKAWMMNKHKKCNSQKRATGVKKLAWWEVPWRVSGNHPGGKQGNTGRKRPKLKWDSPGDTRQSSRYGMTCFAWWLEGMLMSLILLLNESQGG